MQIIVSEDFKEVLKKNPKFPLGSLVRRHLKKDWGTASDIEKYANNSASEFDTVISEFEAEGEVVVVSSSKSFSSGETIVEVRLNEEF